MSGAASLAAAKRRRSKVDSSRSTTSNTSTSSNTGRSNTSTNNNSMPPRLNVQQSFQYMWQKILQVESMVNNNTTLVNNTSSSSSNNFEINNLRQKISVLEGTLNKLSTTSNTTVEVDGTKYVSVDQFNDVMNKVALDMQNVSEKLTQLTDYVSNVQNNNVVLRNMLDSLQGNTFAFDDNGSVGLSVSSSVNEDVVEEEDGEEENGEEDTENDNDDISATPDVSSVLDKLKTLNSEDIKQEVAAELNNNITLVVDENSNNSPSDSAN